MMLPTAPNQCCSLDVVSDALNSSRGFGLLAVVDDVTRECLDLMVDVALEAAYQA